MDSDPEPDFIKNLNESIFTIPTALSTNDKASFLRIQQLVRRERGSYSYLEIGSEQGASLQPHLLDRACASAVSIDLRPPAQPDERGRVFYYADNSTERMRETLKQHIGADPLKKLKTFDADASNVDASSLPGPIDLAMIDAEHTNTACFSDFLQVLTYARPSSLISFHDANLILDAIQNAEKVLSYLSIPFETVLLPDCVAVIGTRAMAAPVLKHLGPLGHQRNKYIEASKRELQRAVAASVIDKTETLHPVDQQVALQEVIELRQENKYLKNRERLMDDEVAALHLAMARAAQRISNLEQSMSWRISAPVRRIIRTLRGH